MPTFSSLMGMRSHATEQPLGRWRALARGLLNQSLAKPRQRRYGLGGGFTRRARMPVPPTPTGWTDKELCWCGAVELARSCRGAVDGGSRSGAVSAAAADPVADLRAFVEAGFHGTTDAEYRAWAEVLATTTDGPTTRQAATEALAGTDAELHAFVDGGYQAAWNADERLRLARVLAAATGPAVTAGCRRPWPAATPRVVRVPLDGPARGAVRRRPADGRDDADRRREQQRPGARRGGAGGTGRHARRAARVRAQRPVHGARARRSGGRPTRGAGRPGQRPRSRRPSPHRRSPPAATPAAPLAATGRPTRRPRRRSPRPRSWSVPVSSSSPAAAVWPDGQEPATPRLER